MSKDERPATREELDGYAARALEPTGFAYDPQTGGAYVLAKQSRFDIEPTVVVLPAFVIARLAITYIQQAQQIKDIADSMSAKSLTGKVQ
jgi:hypothetical protein